MQEYTVTREEQKDLRFLGEILAESSNKWVAGKDKTRWHELTLYRTASGKYVLQDDYWTLWQGEENSRTVEVFNTAEELLEFMIDEEGSLSDLEKQILQLAAKTYPAFADLWVEVLE